MDPARIHIDPTPHTERLLRGTLVLRIRDSKLAFQDEMCCKASMSVWTVMSVASWDGGISPVLTDKGCTEERNAKV